MKNGIALNIYKKRKLISLILSILVIAGLVGSGFFSASAQYSSAPSAPGALFFQPANLSVANDQDFTLDAMFNPPASGQAIAVQLRVTFDASKFQAVDVNNDGSLFNEILKGTGQPDYVIDNNAGTVSIDLAVKTGGNPVSVLSKVATFKFHSIAAATNSSITFADNSIALGESMENLVSSRMSASVTVEGQSPKYNNSNFAQLVTDWLQTKSSPADVNNDGKVNSRDLGIMMSNWEAQP